jgi:hypothetical protein
LFLSIFSINSLLTATNILLIKKFDLNLPPGYFGDVLLLCHMLGTNLNLPGALKEFNRKVVGAVTLNFDQIAYISDYLKPNELDELKPNLVNVGYQFISALSNIKLPIFAFIILAMLTLIFSSAILYCLKKRTRITLHLKESYVNALEHLSTPCFFSF